MRWRGLLALALMAGLIAAVVLGAAAGARRTASALDRFRDIGVALGLFLRAVWSTVVGSLGVDDAPTPPAAFVVRSVPAAILLAVVCSWWPGRVASARSVVEGLRSE